MIKMKVIKRVLAVFTLASVLFFSSCIDRLYGFDTEMPTGEVLTPEMIDSIIDAATVAEVEKYPIETDEAGSLVVYWLPGGSVWHASKSCSSVAKSDPAKVISGSIANAISEGKDRACQKCSKDIEYDIPSLEIDTQSDINTTNVPSTDGVLTSDEMTNAESMLVYWTKSGSVWHLSTSCSSLAKTDPAGLLSGTEDDAIAAGKERVCKKCS